MSLRNTSSEQFDSSLSQGSAYDSRQWTDNDAEVSRSGSVPEDPRFDGDSSNNHKYDLQKSNSGNNPNIGRIGWGS